MSDPSRVVARVRPAVQCVTVPLLGVFVVGIAWGVVDAAAHGDAGYPFRTSSLGGVGVTVGWVIAAVIFLFSLFGVLALLRLRVVLTPAGFDARLFFRHYRLTAAQVTQIQALFGTPYPTTQPKFPGIRVTARDADGRRRGFQLSGVYTGTARAMPVLAQWVRANPAVVQDDVTAAAFGVTRPAAPATPPPATAGPATFLRTDGSSFTAGDDPRR